MAIIGRPNRGDHSSQAGALIDLDQSGASMMETPDRLSVDEIKIASALFQPRETSLAIAGFKSDQHVKTLLTVVRRGRELDPVSVVSFGDKWFLIDGHHRIEAYRIANYKNSIPVTAHTSDKRGQERVAWAISLSTELNSKDKLPMSSSDKADAAWRLCVEGGLTKEQIGRSAGCATSTVGNMRRMLSQLRESGRFDESDLIAWTWGRARFEALRMTGEDDLAPMPSNRELRILVKKLRTVINPRVSPHLVVRAMEELEPGYSVALRAAIDEWGAGPDI